MTGVTYGQIRSRVAAECPSVSLALIDGYLLDRYTSILDRLQWLRQESTFIVRTPAPYDVGTLAVTAGSATVTVTGGTFSADMTGRAIRVSNRAEFYEFRQTAPGAGALDRPYEGETEGAASYTIFQTVYPLPATVRIVKRVLGPYGALDPRTGAQLDATTGDAVTGAPLLYAPYMDDGSDPPQMQLRVWPAPDTEYTLTAVCTVEAPTLAGTSTALLPWMRPSCLVAGALADACEKLRDFDRADRQELKYEKYLADMIRTDSANRPNRPLRLARWIGRRP